MGPGTHVVDRVFQGVRPTSQPDSVALQHDIDYLTKEEPIISDLRAIVRSNNSFQGQIMKAGLMSRSIADAFFHMNPIANLLHINPTHINNRTDSLKYTDSELNKRLKDEVIRQGLNLSDDMAKPDISQQHVRWL